MKICDRCKAEVPPGRLRCVCKCRKPSVAFPAIVEDEPEEPVKKGRRPAPRPTDLVGRIDLYTWRAENQLPLFEE